MVNRGPNPFEGYWRNPEADAARRRDGWYWTGDLFYRDPGGFLYFAGRTDDRLRVDSENLAAAVIENILARYEGAEAVAVYAVPDPVAGDQVMATIAGAFDPDGFAEFLVSQPDLGTKMTPRFVRVVPSMPVTATNKIQRAALRREGFPLPGPGLVAPTGEMGVPQVLRGGSGAAGGGVPGAGAGGTPDGVGPAPPPEHPCAYGRRPRPRPTVTP